MGVNKAKGIERILEHTGISRDDSYAFGDSANDIDMIQYVKYGTAMGNSVPELLEIAPYKTARADEDGIEKGLKIRSNLIRKRRESMKILLKDYSDSSSVIIGCITSASSKYSGKRWSCNTRKTTAKQPSIYGKSGIVIDAKSGKILFQKKIDDRHYPASITKILTTLVAIENNKDLYDEVNFSSYAVNSIEPGSTHIGIQAGEKIP